MSSLLNISAQGSGNPLLIQTASKVVEYILSLKNEEKFVRGIVGDLKGNLVKMDFVWMWMKMWMQNGLSNTFSKMIIPLQRITNKITI